MKQAFVISLIALSLVSCKDDQLKTVARTLKIVAESIGVVQTTIIEANKQKLVSDDDTLKFLTLCVTINKSGQEASALTRNLSSLGITDKVKIVKIFDELLTAISRAIDNDLTGIKNEVIKLKVKTSLETIQATIKTVQATLRGV